MRTKTAFIILLLLTLLSNTILPQTPGSINWELDLGGRIFSCPAIGDDGTIYVTSENSKLYAVNSDGTKKWEFVSDDMIYSSPVLGDDGTIYFGSNDKKLYALNPDGTKKWEFTTDDKITATPAIGHNGTIYIGSYDKNIYAINSDGTLNWKFQTNKSNPHSPVIGHDGTIYQVSEDGSFYALNSNGTLKWKLYSGVPSSPVIDEDGTIYIFSLNDNLLHALYPDGSQKWELKIKGPFVSSVEKIQIVIGSGNDLYIQGYHNGSEDGDLNYLFSVTKSGELNWYYYTENDWFHNELFSPIIGNDGTIYFNGYYSRLFAFNADGTIKWEKQYPAWPWPPNYSQEFTSIFAMDKSGNIIAGNLQGKLFSISSGSNSLAESPWPKFNKTYKNQASYFNANYPHALVAKQEISTLTGKAVLDGTNSYDMDGENLSYLWSIIKNPSNDEIIINNPTSPQTEVNLPEERGIYSFSLKVTDTQGNSSYNTVNVNNGIKWVFSTVGSIYSSPAIGNDGNIYFGNTNNNFYSINPNGSLNWTFSTDGEIYSSPAIGYDETIYFGSNDKKLYALNPDGTKKWELYRGQTHEFISIGNDGTIFFSDYELVAVNPDGTIKWSDDVSGERKSSPVIGLDGTVLSNVDYRSGSQLSAFDNDGNMKWSQHTKFSAFAHPQVAIDFWGNIYIGSADILFAINPDGTKKWECKIAAYTDIRTSPSIGNDGTIYFGAGLNTDCLYAVTPEGTEKWKYLINGIISSTPLVGEDGTIYFGSDNKNFYALNPDGTLQWKLLTNAPITNSPTIQNDGTIYFGCSDGKFYAVSTDSKGLADSPWPKVNRDIRNSGNACKSVHNISYKISLPNCENSVEPIEIINGKIYEGNKIVFPEFTLPTELSIFQNYFNFLAGLEIVIPIGSLKENITIDFNLNLLCETGISDNPTTEEIFELLSMYIKVIGDTSGVHDLSDYYYLQDEFEVAIKIPITNIKNLLGLTELNNIDFLPFSNKNGNEYNSLGMRSMVDSIYLTIYSNQLTSINLDYKLNLTDIANKNEIPSEYALFQNYPNPFNPTTTIKYSIQSNVKSETKNVKLKVFDVLGKEVETLVNENKSPGNYEVNFNASNFAAGVYYYQLKTSDFVQTKKMILIK